MPPTASSFPSTHPSLLARVQEQQAEAWAVFFRRYQAVILGWCRRKGLSHTDADEVTQAFLVEAPRKLRAYHLVDDDGEPNRFRSWLKTVIERRIADYRRAAVRRERIEAALTADAAHEVADELLDALAHEVESVVASVRARVRPVTWETFERCELLDESPAEVARSLGKTQGAVFVAVHRVHAMLAASGVLLTRSHATHHAKDSHGTVPEQP